MIIDSVTRQSNSYKHTRKVVPIYSGNTFPKREFPKREYSKWFKKNITENQFAEENVDYFPFVLRYESLTGKRKGMMQS